MRNLERSSARHARLMNRFAVALCYGALSSFVPSALAYAQAPTSAGEIHKYDIPAGPLGAALSRFADESGLSLAYPGSLPEGLNTRGVGGEYSAVSALGRLLAGTGLVYRFTGKGTVAIEKAPDAAGALVTGPVRVEGDLGNAPGANGSSDPTATEGTKSYAGNESGIASGGSAESMKDTPQSVSVITQQRMIDQNINDFTSAMNQAPGITLIQGGSNLDYQFYSRGFLINNIQIDGGAPISLDGIYQPQIDMAEYDHVEILRGADGLFLGAGAPAGSVNLTRKRPLDHNQVVIEGAYGSWDNKRTMLDVTGPLGFDGHLRGRAVVTYQDQDYFYKVAHNEHNLFYGIVEADLTPNLMVSGGVSLTNQDSTPWVNGLMRYANGEDLDLPRDTSFTTPWSRWNFDTKELFLKAEQHWGDNWTAKFNLSRIDQTSDSKYATIANAVNPINLTGPAMGGIMAKYHSIQTLADITVRGGFDLFGHRQEILFGVSRSESDAAGSTYYDPLYSFFSMPPVDVFTFNPAGWPEPASTQPNTANPVSTSIQEGAFLRAKLTFWDPLHLIMGLRYNNSHNHNVSETLCTSQYIQWGMCNTVGEVVGTPFETRGHVSDSSWPPNVSLVYDLNKETSVYVGYTDIFSYQNQDLDPQHRPLPPLTGSNVEAGLKFASSDGRLNASIAAFRVGQRGMGLPDYRYPQETIGDSTCCYYVSNEADVSKGLDAEIAGEILPGLQLLADYTFQFNHQMGSAYGSDEGKPNESRVPKHMLKLWADYHFQSGKWLHRLSVGGGFNAQSQGYYSGYSCVKFVVYGNYVDCDWANNGSIPYTFTQGFYTVFSGRLGYQLAPHWNLALNINNILDRRYYQTVADTTSGNWYGAPRNFMLTLRGQY
jgi:TonB-dependent siderophore receptor